MDPLPPLPISATQNENPNRCSGEKQNIKNTPLQRCSIAHSKINNNKNKYTYYCEKCNYNTSRKANYSRHLLSIKHKLRKDISMTGYICDICHKIYSDRSGLWKHKQKSCKKKINKKMEKNNNFNHLVKTLVDENKKLTETIRDMAPQIGSNTINNNSTSS